MEYKGYIFSFSAALHAGAGKLEDAGWEIYADTLFSALCHEALAQGGQPLLRRLVAQVEENRLRLSDAFPVHQAAEEEGGTTFYVPKPFMKTEHAPAEESSRIKKSIKKMKYLPFSSVATFAAGKFDPLTEGDKLSGMGKSEVRTMSAVSEGENAKPYSVGAFNFAPDWALYMILGYEKAEDAAFVEALLTGLGYAGIGGKRSAGLGRFALHPTKLPAALTDSLVEGKRQGRFMSLSPGLPEDREMAAVTADAQYLLLQRRGFVSSETFAETFQKKSDFYCFKAGSTFGMTFQGRLENVAAGGAHPVYRYAKPIFMEVG